MKKMNNKGFTIVELVIVIAVIAILAAVMIPTFSGIIDKANASAAQQKAAAKFKELYALDLADGVVDKAEKGVAMSDANGYTVANGVASYVYTSNGYTSTYNGTTGEWTTTKAAAQNGQQNNGGQQ